MSSQRFMYHAFPRRGREHENRDEKGLRILQNIVRSGLLLTPERIEWPGEFFPGGKRGKPFSSYNTHACFTELALDELPSHAESFGAFAIEFDIMTLRTLGAAPVLYIPLAEDDAGLLGVGEAFMARLLDMTMLLERLQAFLQFAEPAAAAGPNFHIRVVEDPDTRDLFIATEVPAPSVCILPRAPLDQVAQRNPSFVPPALGPQGAPIGCDTGGLLTIMRILTWGIQSFDEQLKAIRGMTGLFYPTERAGADDKLLYYRQREWRIVGGRVKDGAEITSKPTDEEIEVLIEIDRDFFTKVLQLRSKGARRVDECQYLRSVEGKPFIAHARSVVCPTSAVTQVEKTLADAGLAIPVRAIEASF